MKLKVHTTLIASAIAALLAGPTWATSDTPQYGAQISAPAKDQIDQSEVDQLNTAQQLSETPQMNAATSGGALITPSIGNNPLYTRSADDLDGVEVVDSTGEKVGKVKQIVLSPDCKSAHAKISVSGILGIGAHDIIVSLDDLKPIDDKLQMSATKSEIDALKNAAPDADQYVEVKGDTPISGSIVEFSAFEPGKEADQPGVVSSSPKGDVLAPATTPETPKALQ